MAHLACEVRYHLTCLVTPKVRIGDSLGEFPRKLTAAAILKCVAPHLQKIFKFIKLCLESERSHINIAHLRCSITNLPKESCLTSVERVNDHRLDSVPSPVLDPSKQPYWYQKTQCTELGFCACSAGPAIGWCRTSSRNGWDISARNDVPRLARSSRVEFGGLGGLPATMLHNVEIDGSTKKTLMNWCLCSLKQQM